MFEEVVKGIFVGLARMVWSTRWGGVSSSSAVRLEELFGLWVAFVEGVGSNVEEGEATFVIGKKIRPLNPQIRVVSHDGFLEARGAGGVKEKGFGVCDDKKVTSPEILRESGDGGMELSSRDRLMSRA